jgi:uncharacterized membrane protein HdeD (DUF308 family)
LLVNGLISVALGVTALVLPRTLLELVAVLFAITLLTNGVAQLVIAAVDGNSTGARRMLLGLLGPLGILAGVLCLVDPKWTIGAVALLIGACLAVNGVVTLVAVLNGTVREGRAWAALRGMFDIVGGLIIVVLPAISLFILALALGVLLIVLGLLLLVDACYSLAGRLD